MLYTLETARDRIRNEDGKRVFYLTPGDRLTPSARDYLDHEQVRIQAVQDDRFQSYETLFGAVLTHKPEHMTQLHGNVLVFKDHPRILFRGKMDSLQAEILLCCKQTSSDPQVCQDLNAILDYLRKVLRAEVLSEPAPELKLWGLNESELRERSHHPERWYRQSHFMPSSDDTPMILYLNRLRTQVRECEIAAYQAFRDENGLCTRSDILLAMNRLSSALYLMMIRLKSGDYPGGTIHE